MQETNFQTMYFRSMTDRHGNDASVPAAAGHRCVISVWFYAVLRTDAPEGSAQRRLFDFLKTEEGQRLVRDCGYAGAGDVVMFP